MQYFLFGHVVDKDQERFKLRNDIKMLKQMKLELDNAAQPAGTRTNLHYVSVFSCYEDEK